MLKKNPFQNYIPWRTVWNENYFTRPCGIASDASNITDSGHSLNNILVEGCNNMKKLVEVFIRWTSHVAVLHTEVQKMYDTITTSAKGLVLAKIYVGRKSQSQ